MHTREKLPLGIELSMNFNPDSQLPAVRARVIGLGLLGRSMSIMLFLVVYIISNLFANGRARPLGDVTRVKIAKSTRMVDVDS